MLHFNQPLALVVMQISRLRMRSHVYLVSDRIHVLVFNS